MVVGMVLVVLGVVWVVMGVAPVVLGVLMGGPQTSKAIEKYALARTPTLGMRRVFYDGGGGGGNRGSGGDTRGVRHSIVAFGFLMGCS